MLRLRRAPGPLHGGGDRSHARIRGGGWKPHVHTDGGRRGTPGHQPQLLLRGVRHRRERRLCRTHGLLQVPPPQGGARVQRRAQQRAQRGRWQTPQGQRLSRPLAVHQRRGAWRQPGLRLPLRRHAHGAKARVPRALQRAHLLSPQPARVRAARVARRRPPVCCREFAYVRGRVVRQGRERQARRRARQVAAQTWRRGSGRTGQRGARGERVRPRARHGVALGTRAVLPRG
mmetsp:Transcript_8023/g.22066  ORF Transcript_8023/g.22066 Transcript_8023/m.22066 type:complete len:231 (-) Transcript_8023:904-1596(-)